MKLKNWLKGKILVVAHAGDIDACGSFIAFRELAKKLNPRIRLEFCITGKTNKDAQRVLNLFRFRVKPLSKIKLKMFRKMVLLDTQPEVLPDAKFPKDIFIIDHHVPSKAVKKAKNKVIDAKAVAATEIVYSIFKSYKINPSKNAAKAIAYGIMSDTGGFRFAKTRTFKLIYDLLSSHKVDYQKLLKAIAVGIELQEKIAWLKTAKRLKITRFRNKILVISRVGSYESSACQKLLSLGADVALVVSRKNKETRIAGRARAGFNLAKIFINVSEILGGSGGGHPGAAGLIIPAGKEQEALSYIVKAIKK